MFWRYLPDGLLADVRDLGGQRELYSYDANGNLTLAIETSGATLATQSPLRIERSFDGFDQLTKTRSPEPGVAGSYLASLYSYDANGNTSQLTENRKENQAGAQTAAGRVFSYCYDGLDQVVAQTDDYGTPSGVTCSAGTPQADDEKLTWSYTPSGLTDTRTLFKGTGSAWAQEQKQQNTYFDDGELKQRSSYDGANSLVEQHTLSYVDAGVYMDGNRVSDSFQVKQADGSSTCWSAACTASWGYDARDRLISEDAGTGSGPTSFLLDTVGNALSEGGAISRSFSGQKLVSQTSNGTTTKFLYDGLGNVDCSVVNAYAGSTCPAGLTGSLVEDYTYDYKNRLVGYAKWNGSSLTDSASYLVDALDRPVSETETHGGSSTTTVFRYRGDTNAVTQETLSGATNTTKKYAYAADGDRITISDGSSRYSYLYDPHGSVSLLLDQASGVKASYGYTAYGAADAAVTKTASGFTDRNPYRYTGKRLDTGSNTYDMGARRYSPATGRWLQQDLYYDALANLALAEDPLDANRYLFTGANPVNYVELDGHLLCEQCAGGGQPSCAGAQPDQVTNGQCEGGPAIPPDPSGNDPHAGGPHVSDTAEFNATCRDLDTARLPHDLLVHEYQRCAQLWAELKLPGDWLEHTWHRIALALPRNIVEVGEVAHMTVETLFYAGAVVSGVWLAVACPAATAGFGAAACVPLSITLISVGAAGLAGEYGLWRHYIRGHERRRIQQHHSAPPYGRQHE